LLLLIYFVLLGKTVFGINNFLN